MITVLVKEINEYLNSMIAYISIGVFLIAVGSIMWILPDTNVLDYGYATMDPVFGLGPFVFVFLVPAITMRSFAEENRSGTLELLFTLPFRTWQIIYGKFFASWIIVVFSLLPTLLFYFSVYQLGNPVGNIDTSGILGSYLGLALLGGVFVSVGLLTSSITENQIVAFILSALICIVLYIGFDLLASFEVFGSLGYYIQMTGLNYHYDAMSKGLLEVSDLIYFVGVSFILLYATGFILNMKRK